MNTQSTVGPLGVLQLQNQPMRLLGALANPMTFHFRTIARPVPGAWVSNVVNGDPDMEKAFVEGAKRLAAEGAAAIVTNCGFAVRFQKAMAKAVPVPVAASSLMLLPFLEVSTDARIGVITYDSRPLNDEVLGLAGTRDPKRMVVVGLEDTPSWEIMARPDAPITEAQLRNDILATVRGVLRSAPDIRAILFECAGFGPASELVRQETNRAVFDVISLGNLVMAGAVGAPGFRDKGAP